MKKLLSLLLTVMMVCSLVACSSKDNTKPEDSKPESGVTENNPNTDAPVIEGEENTPQSDTGVTPEDGTLIPSDSKPTMNADTNQPNKNTNKPSTSKPNTNTSKPSTNKPNTNTSKPSTNKPNTDTNKPSPTPPQNNGSANTDKGDLLSLMATLLKGTESDMSVSTEEISPDSYQYHLFIDYLDGYKAVSSAPMMGSIAHSVCLLQVPAGTDVAAVAAKIDKNKDPRKWICVEAEKSVVLHKGNYILLAMSETATVDTIVQNFNANF